jgi:proteasome lid subunit RPN8/RPN11
LNPFGRSLSRLRQDPLASDAISSARIESVAKRIYLVGAVGLRYRCIGGEAVEAVERSLDDSQLTGDTRRLEPAGIVDSFIVEEIQGTDTHPGGNPDRSVQRAGAA